MTVVHVARSWPQFGACGVQLQRDHAVVFDAVRLGGALWCSLSGNQPREIRRRSIDQWRFDDDGRLGHIGREGLPPPVERAILLDDVHSGDDFANMRSRRAGQRPAAALWACFVGLALVGELWAPGRLAGSASGSKVVVLTLMKNWDEAGLGSLGPWPPVRHSGATFGQRLPGSLSTGGPGGSAYLVS
jgi:hypothetical protein